MSTHFPIQTLILRGDFCPSADIKVFSNNRLGFLKSTQDPLTISEPLFEIGDGCNVWKGKFLADITWKRYAAHSLSKSAVDTISDHLLYYAKDNKHVMANRVTAPLDTEELNKKFPHVETETGCRFQHVALEQNSNRSSAGESRKIGDKTVTSDIG